MRTVIIGKQQRKHEMAKCANRSNCTGPGCRLVTGKTEKNHPPKTK